RFRPNEGMQRQGVVLAITAVLVGGAMADPVWAQRGTHQRLPAGATHTYCIAADESTGTTLRRRSHDGQTVRRAGPVLHREESGPDLSGHFGKSSSRSVSAVTALRLYRKGCSVPDCR